MLSSWANVSAKHAHVRPGPVLRQQWVALPGGAQAALLQPAGRVQLTVSCRNIPALSALGAVYTKLW